MSQLVELPKYTFTKYNKKLDKVINYKIVGHVDSLISEGCYIMLPLHKDIPERDIEKYAIRVKKHKVDEKIWMEEKWQLSFM